MSNVLGRETYSIEIRRYRDPDRVSILFKDRDTEKVLAERSFYRIANNVVYKRLLNLTDSIARIFKRRLLNQVHSDQYNNYVDLLSVDKTNGNFNKPGD